MPNKQTSKSTSKQGNTLVIVESPAKAKTIGKYLGSKYHVLASVGHIRDLPKSKLGVDIGNRFEPEYITVRGKGDVLKSLRDAKKKAGRVFLAADPDREGESIAWHLATYLNINEDEACRVVFNEITKDAVKDAFKTPRKINMDLVNAQQARRILDRIVGYKISPLLWKKVKKGLSAGRVQSVTVKLIIDREREIEAFTEEEYWSLHVQLHTGEQTFTAKFSKYLGKDYPMSNEQAVLALIEHAKRATFLVSDVVKKEKFTQPKPPFITSTMQQEAARKLSFRTTRTMSVAQKLYEGLDIGKEGTVGLITYMRTDSTRVSQTAQDEAKQWITQHFGANYVPAQARNYSKKANAQDAHEAIRPTSVLRTPESLKPFLDRDQFRLYKLIWDRFVASQMAAAIADSMTVDITAGDILFRATGSKIKFAGFTKVYEEGRDTEEDKNDEQGLLPALNVGQTLQCDAYDPKQHFTQPPARYTEAKLIQTLEEKGIGRPSTYAATLDTIQKRGYAILESKKFIPTEMGRLVNDLMEEFFADILDVEFTAGFESKLDHVEHGDADRVEVLAHFYQSFEGLLEKAEEEMRHIVLVDEVSTETCEKCGRHMVFKLGKKGKFLACSGFPECRNTRRIEKHLGVDCPKCKVGKVVERKGKRRQFFGCNQYPNCDFVSWDRPLPVSCPSCAGLLVLKRDKTGLKAVCSSCSFQDVADSYLPEEQK
jgi:DNA topoisomerase-1